ncbi:lysozyme inhibitor LprI family protein [Litorisediminicola beolgyonensis]|uniref:Lysozyme inhibitor LprI family protein n=1 Tax=Litorisediminicola beolgyonensis TaxID=1173614 RepID=A0ABW3ZMB7_9RHOB
MRHEATRGGTRLWLSLCAGLAAAMLLAPGLAQAQGAGDQRALEGCTAGAGQARAAEARCIGLLSEGCRDQTTLGISECLMAEQKAWDALLNRWWGPMRERAKANGSWDRLLAGQRAWIAEKEAACQAAYDSAGGGSIRVIYAAECLRDRTAQKAIEFYYSLNR